MRPFVLAALATMIATSAGAAPFKIIRADDESMSVIDLGRLTKSPNGIARGWRAYISARPHGIPLSDETISLFEWDCVGARYRIFAEMNYLDGKLVNNLNKPNGGEWSPVGPETVGEVTLTRVCTGRYLLPNEFESISAAREFYKTVMLPAMAASATK